MITLNKDALDDNETLHAINTVGNHVIYIYIPTERVRIFVIISLMLSEFSYSKDSMSLLEVV